MPDLEILVWRVPDREIDWFVLREKQYERLMPDSEGILRSTVFPGLWLDWRAIIDGNMAQVFAALDRGTATAEHAEFAEQLRR